jgi:iron complex transport system substrate-binding protein
VLRRSFVVAVALTAALSLVPAASSAGGAAPSPFPVTVTVANGKVTVPRKPRRIVSLSATATESLFAIGAGPQVVAVDSLSDYPRSAPSTSLSGYTPNVEALAAFRPDLVVAFFDANGLVDALARLGIPVIVQEPAKTLAGAYQQIRQLGRVTGNATPADALTARMKRQIDRMIASSRRGKSRLSVYHELTPDLYSATSGTFVGKVYAALGLRNIADAAGSTGSGYPQLSGEYVVSANPDVVVLADTVCCGESLKTVAARPGWSRVTAVRTGSVVRMDDSIASRWGPRLVNLFRAMSAALARIGS